MGGGGNDIGRVACPTDSKSVAILRRTAFTLYNLSQMVFGLCVMVWRKRKRKQEKKERQRRKMIAIYDHEGQ